MADINSPKEYLAELLEVSDELEAAKDSRNKTSEARKQSENSLTSLKNTIEKEKNNTVKKRRAELASGYDKQLKALDADMKKARDKRQKALNAEIRKKTEQATSGIRKQTADTRKALNDYVSSGKLPGILKSRIYYKIFCPGYVGYLVLVGLFAIIISVAFLMARNSIAAGGSAAVFIATGLLDLALLFAYIFIWSNTRVRYRDEISECLGMIKNIQSYEKDTRRIERDIRKAGDDNTYDLSRYDDEISELSTRRDGTDKNRTEALEQFDNVTAQSLKDGIDANYRIRLEDLEYRIGKSDEELGRLDERISALEARITSEFVPYVGLDNINHARIEKLISILESGQADTVSAAVSQLEQPEKQ